MEPEQHGEGEQMMADPLRSEDARNKRARGQTDAGGRKKRARAHTQMRKGGPHWLRIVVIYRRHLQLTTTNTC